MDSVFRKEKETPSIPEVPLEYEATDKPLLLTQP